MPSEVGGMIETVRDDPIFEFDVIRVDVARWLDIGQPGTRAERQAWKSPSRIGGNRMSNASAKGDR
jgi:hypothetical protein